MTATKLDAVPEPRFDSAGREIKSNRAWREECESLRQQLAEYQARERAKHIGLVAIIDDALKQALLEAAETFEILDEPRTSQLRRMADEFSPPSEKALPP